MGRTVGDVPVVGRSYADVRSTVQQWMSAQGLNLKQEAPGVVVANKGSMWLFGEKVFAISILPQQWGVLVHTEGYMPEWTGGEMDFDPGSIYGAIPRRAGWRTINDLWERLRALSVPGIGIQSAAIPHDPPPTRVAHVCGRCGGGTEFVSAYGRWFCRRCGLYV